MTLFYPERSAIFQQVIILGAASSALFGLSQAYCLYIRDSHRSCTGAYLIIFVVAIYSATLIQPTSNSTALKRIQSIIWVTSVQSQCT
jgi:hypothetical protein